MPTTARAHVSPGRLRTDRLKRDAIRSRSAGLTYRAIGRQLRISHVYARRLCEEAYREAAETTRHDATAALGEELDRLKGLISSASAIMLAPQTSVAEKLRAMNEIRACSEARVRWLGLAVSDRARATPPSRTELHRTELAGLGGTELDKELRALGIRFADQLVDE